MNERHYYQFQLDGALGHRDVCLEIFRIFEVRSIGPNGSRRWTTRSHALTPLDFFVGVYKK